MSHNLSGCNGNAFAIMGRTSKLLRDAGVSEKEIDDIIQQAKSRDYDNLLRVCIVSLDKHLTGDLSA